MLRDEVVRLGELFQELPESFQDSERGETIQEAIELLETATGDIDEVIDALEQAQGG